MRLGLAQRLILLLTTVVIVTGIIAGFVIVSAQERHLLSAMVLGADQLSKGITSATWSAMLTDNKEAAYEVMTKIAEKQGIERIRMFNREGRVKFSTRAGDTEQVLSKSAAACAVCHAANEPKIHVNASSRVRVLPGEEGHRNLTMVTPIYNEPSCSQASCHAHPSAIKVLGVLDVTLNLDDVDREIASAKLRILTVVVVQVALISISIIFFTRRFVSRPILSLIAATRTVSEMNLEEHIKGTESRDELGELARSFDSMRAQLREAMREINQFTQKLETKVAERTEQLRMAHRKLLQTDRLASLGQLSASVAHEINNPISGVLNLSMLMQRILKNDGIPPGREAEFRQYLGQVVNETSRVGRIVSDLLAFSRRSKPNRAETDLNKIVTTTLALVSHKMKLSNVEVEVDLAPALPPLLCDSSQIQQVVLNLVMNGAEATHGRPGGKVFVRTQEHETLPSLVLAVSDNGEGIPEEHLTKIFDPFFTTKPEGKGVGLGLAVVYGIVEAHGGEVAVSSRFGEGTTFTVTLPRKSMEAAEVVIGQGAPVAEKV